MLQIKMCQYLLFPGFPSAVSIAGRKIKKITFFFFLPSVSKPAWARGSSDTQMSLWGGLWLGMNFPSLFFRALQYVHLRFYKMDAFSEASGGRA